MEVGRRGFPTPLERALKQSLCARATIEAFENSESRLVNRNARESREVTRISSENGPAL